MADTKTRYEKQLVDNAEMMTRDELIVDSPRAAVIKISTAGTYKRGTLLMEGTTAGEYVNATAAGVKTKDSVILADDVEISANEYAEAAAYYSGTFKADKVILPYEQETDSHADLIAAISNELRKQNILLA